MKWNKKITTRDIQADDKIIIIIQYPKSFKYVHTECHTIRRGKSKMVQRAKKTGANVLVFLLPPIIIRCSKPLGDRNLRSLYCANRARKVCYCFLQHVFRYDAVKKCHEWLQKCAKQFFRELHSGDYRKTIHTTFFPPQFFSETIF